MASVTRSIEDMWNDYDVSVSGVDPRRKVPAMPRQSEKLQVVTGSADAEEIMAIAILGIQASMDKNLIVRLLCSAVAAVLDNVTTNFTGSSEKPLKITGTEFLEDPDKVDPNAFLRTNIEDYPENVTHGQVLALFQADVDELAACIGLYVWATCKKPTADNITAFNENRKSAALAGTIVDPMIFTDNSPFLDLPTMRKINGSFTSLGVSRSHMINYILPEILTCHQGAKLAFANQFMLLKEVGMGALAIIRDGLSHYPWIRAEFPEIENEVKAAQRAFDLIRKVADLQRPFIKAIHGQNFVPVSYQEVAVLTGICKSALTHARTSYANYAGGSTTPAIEQRIRNRIAAMNGPIVDNGSIRSDE